MSRSMVDMRCRRWCSSLMGSTLTFAVMREERLDIQEWKTGTSQLSGVCGHCRLTG